MLGFDPGGGQPALAALVARLHPTHRRAFYRQALRGRRDGGFQAELALSIPGRDRAWLALRVRRLRPEEGPAGMMMGLCFDITDRKRAEQRAALLAHEVEHRAKNVLGVVNSMLRVTSAETLDEFVDVLEGRVRALAGAMTLLGERSWSGALLGDLAAHELLPFGQAARLEGPDLVIGPDAAQSVSMALHELTTNAAKHGGLSRPQGRVSLRWWREGDLVQLEWRETGGPPVAGPPVRQSFGSLLIHETLLGLQGGAVEKRWEAAGLVCLMQFRLTDDPRG